ncbi:MAG: ATP-binding protein [Nitrospirae bacterium]|nr:ATP-binding protein [Nitrospirota bacterium]MCL5236820.1 ATP-binding protein [Nitrospirota bacterium]
MSIFGSIKFKLLFLALLVVFVITSLIVWSDIEDTKDRLIAVQKEKAILLSDIIRQSIMILMIENRWRDLQIMIEDMAKNNPELKEVRIFHPVSGRIIVSGNTRDIGKRIYAEDWDRFKRKEELPFVIKKDGEIFATRVAAIHNIPACFRCHPPREKVLGVLDVEVSLAVARQSIRELTYKHIMGLVLGFIGIGTIFLIGGERLINNPLKKLTEVMKSVESGDLSVRAKGDDRDELGYLARAFNNMIDSLEAATREIDSYHRQQMERAAKLASLGEIVSGIAHEIKNPLAGISCAVQVFRSELDENDSKKVIINEILNQVNRLDRTVKDLLSYAKPKPPQLLLSGINDVMEKALFFVYPEAKKQNIAIETRIEKDIPDILMDTDQIQQVFLNIIINAIQSMPAGGVLSISISGKGYQEIKDEIGGSLNCGRILIIRFQDTGKGVAPEDLECIFEPFFTKKSKGTGLGLSISRKIIQEHGGEITVKSALGKGSVFTIYLPVKSKMQSEKIKDNELYNF